MEPIDDDDVDVASAVIESPQFLIENLLAIGLNILVAPAKSGKSLWATIMACIIAKFPVKALPEALSRNTNGPGHVLIIPAESTPGSIKNDIENGLRLKLDKSFEGFINVSNDPWRYFMSIKEPNPHETLLSKIERYDDEGNFIGPRLLVIDPLIDFHDADENSAGEMIRILKPIRDWVYKHQCAIILVHHTGKLSADNRGNSNHKYGVHDPRGTSAIFGKADALLLLTPKVEDKISPVTLKAIFKRAAPVEMDVELAVWNSPLDRGREKLKELDQTIYDAYVLKGREFALMKSGLPEKDFDLRLFVLKRKGLLK